MTPIGLRPRRPIGAWAFSPDINVGLAMHSIIPDLIPQLNFIIHAKFLHFPAFGEIRKHYFVIVLSHSRC